ncbi:MAG: hypothetical protein ACXVDD_25690, partial [Polyangia bacterium]
MTIAERIARDLGTPDLVDKLIALPANELTSLLLEVTRRRPRTPADLLAQYVRDRTVHPTADDPRALLGVEAHAFAAADAFTPVTLSPVAPLGLNVVLGDIDQNWTLAAVRNLEVLSDPTTMLALESAVQRKRGVRDVRLCAAARMLRMQPFDNPAFSRHFALFAMTSAARDVGAYAFEATELRGHVHAYLRMFQRLAGDGFRLADVRVELADTERDASRLAAAEGVFALRADFPEVTFAIDAERTHAIHYYRGTCFHIFACDVHGERQQL